MQAEAIQSLLPTVFQRTATEGSPLAALLDIMETLHAPSEETLERFADHLSPYRTPDRFVAYLACWVGLERILTDHPEDYARSLPPFPSGTGRLRELIATAAWHARWRGTARGLIHFLETATGVAGFTVDEQVPGEDGQVRAFHIRVVAPPAVRPLEGLVRRIVESEKPAYVTAELAYGGES
jgi:phage tail-like protein